MNIRRFSSLAAGAACAFAVLGASTASATPAITFTGGTETTFFANRTFGFEFSTGRTGFELTSLGYWDAGGDGLAESHEVGIWNADGSVLLASATIPGGVAGFLDNGFRFVAIAPVLLAAGQSYLAGGFIGGAGDAIIRFTDATTDPAISLGSTRFSPVDDPAVLTPPTGTQGDGFDDGYFGPNFNGTTAAVPEPMTWALMIGGFAMVGGMARRRRGALA